MSSSGVTGYTRPLFIASTSLGAYLSGMIASISLITVPALIVTPATSATLTTWRNIYEKGMAAAPPFALAVAAANLTNAYLNYKSHKKRSYYLIAAAVSTVAIVPFTLLIMQGNINELCKLEESARGIRKATIDWNQATDLIRHWGRLNLVRSVLPAVGAAIGFIAARV